MPDQIPGEMPVYIYIIRLLFLSVYHYILISGNNQMKNLYQTPITPTHPHFAQQLEQH